jgi:DNA-directed RNA polymerase subunit RPC12/RpoP
MSVSWEELRRGIKDVVREELGSKGSSDPSETTVEHATHCPKCYSTVIKKMNETSDYACADCGLPLGNEEFATKLENCPNCGHKHLRKVER